MFQYKEGSLNLFSVWRLSFSVVFISVLTGLANCMLVLCKRLAMYCFWLSMRPSDVIMALMQRKKWRLPKSIMGNYSLIVFKRSVIKDMLETAMR